MDDEALHQLLGGGDRRSIGKADEAAARIGKSPAGVSTAIRLMRGPDPLIAMRAADALEKASRDAPHLLLAHKHDLLGDIAKNPQQEIRWHLLQMLPRLPLTPAERNQAFRIALESLGHGSNIVVADALSALFALSAGDPALRSEAERHADRLASSHSAAVRNRARRLHAEERS